MILQMVVTSNEGCLGDGPISVDGGLDEDVLENALRSDLHSRDILQYLLGSFHRIDQIIIFEETIVQMILIDKVTSFMVPNNSLPLYIPILTQLLFYDYIYPYTIDYLQDSYFCASDSNRKKVMDRFEFVLQINLVEVIKYMSYKIAVIALLLTFASAYTDITMLNCPAQFNITEYNSTSDTTVATMGAFIYAGYKSEASRKRVEKIVVNGDKNQLESYTNEMLIPYIIFAVVYFCFYICIVMCCLFDRSCPPCECIRRDIDNEPYSKRQIRVATLVLMLCAAGVLIVSIVAYSFVPAIKNNLEMTNCGIYLALDSAINGDEAWGGFVSLRDKIGNITNLLSAAVTQIQIYFPGDSWLVDSMKAMQTANLDIYNTYKNSQMITPNPDATATAANAGQSTPLIDSRFIKTGLGPNGTANTMVTKIDSGLRTTAKLSNQAYAIAKSAELLQASLSTILANSQASQNTLMMYNRQMQVVVSEYDTFSSEYFQQRLGFAMTVFQAVFGIALAGSLLILLGVVSTHMFDLLTCRKMVHLGWTIYGLSYVGVILVTYYLLAVGSISYNFCEYFNSMLTVRVSYDKLGQAYTQNMFTRLDVCIFGDGNAMEKFSIAKQMETVTSLFTNIATYKDYTSSISNNYVNLAISTGQISGWIGAISNYKLGIYVDTDPSITSNNNPNYAINQLNLYTYQGGGVATGSKDVWVWDKANCTDPSYAIYNATASAGTGLSSTYVTCISFNEKLVSSSPSIWSFSDFTMRYIQIRGSYPDAYNRILFYGQTLIAFRDSRINLFQAIQDDLTSLYTSNINFNTQLNNFASRVSQFEAAVSTLNNLITNSLNGLTVTSNCKTLADKLRFVNNVYCVNLMAQIVKLTLCSLLMLGLMLCGVIVGSRFGMMYAEMEKLKRVNQPEELQSQKDIKGIGQLQEEITNSTHSNESDD